MQKGYLEKFQYTFIFSFEPESFSKMLKNVVIVRCILSLTSLRHPAKWTILVRKKTTFFLWRLGWFIKICLRNIVCLSVYCILDDICHKDELIYIITMHSQHSNPWEFVGWGFLNSFWKLSLYTLINHITTSTKTLWRWILLFFLFFCLISWWTVFMSLCYCLFTMLSYVIHRNHDSFYYAWTDSYLYITVFCHDHTTNYCHTSMFSKKN